MVQVDLPITKFRGFKSANELMVLVRDARTTVESPTIILLSNCEETKQAYVDDFATSVFKKIKERRFDKMQLTYWEFPPTANTTNLPTKREIKHSQFTEELVDSVQGRKNQFIGIIRFYKEGETPISDIRIEGLERGWLKLRSSPNWTHDYAKVSLEVASKMAFKMMPSPLIIEDFRRQQQISICQPFECSVEVSQGSAGYAIGENGCVKKQIESAFVVTIATPAPEYVKKVFKVCGNEKECVEEACKQILSKTRTDYEELDINATQPYEEGTTATLSQLFQWTSKRKFPMSVILARNLISYTLIVEVEIPFDDGTVVKKKVIIDAELIGLQCSTTQAATPSWLNGSETEELLQNCQRMMASILGTRGYVSLEAMGYSKGNTRNNLHVLLYNENDECINELILREGLCKVLQTSIYFDPETGLKSNRIRSFLPYYSGLGNPCHRLSWSEEEILLLDAEREAARASKGIWKQCAAKDSNISILSARKPGSRVRRFVYIDNSNIWISGKNFSGDKQGLGMDRLKNQAEKLSTKWLMADQNDPEKRDARTFFARCPQAQLKVSDRRPYYLSDHSWRLDYLKLLNLISYDKNLDPPFIVAGSVPPQNEDIWNAVRELGSSTFLSERTREGVASSEDTELTLQISFNFEHMNTETDELILFAGDRGFRRVLVKARERCPKMKIVVVAWAHTCYHRLKDMQDPNTYYINLDPYLDYLTISSKDIKELRSDTRIKDANEQHRLVLYTTNAAALEPFTEEVKRYLTNELGLLIDRNFITLPKKQNRAIVLYVIFTSKAKDDGKMAALIAKYNPQKVEPSVKKQAGPKPMMKKNMFMLLDDDSDEEEFNEDAAAEREYFSGIDNNNNSDTMDGEEN